MGGETDIEMFVASWTNISASFILIFSRILKKISIEYDKVYDEVYDKVYDNVTDFEVSGFTKSTKIQIAANKIFFFPKKWKDLLILH